MLGARGRAFSMRPLGELDLNPLRTSVPGAPADVGETARRRCLLTLLGVGVALSMVAGFPAIAAHGAGFTTPIQHVVFLIQENHTFDNVLGAWCAQNGRCDGATTGSVQGGGSVPLAAASDNVVQVIHSSSAQTAAIDGGKMDGFSQNQGCTKTNGYKCYTQYAASSTAIHNVTTLANNFVVSDRTFEDGPTSSWGMHVQAVAATNDGFIGGGTPHPGSLGTLGYGWGCDSGRDTTWMSPQGKQLQVPACVPDPSLSVANGGAYRPTPVAHVPTIMDSLDAAGLTWTLYGGPPGGSTGGQGDASGNAFGYGWAICPTFAKCLNRSPSGMASNTRFASDAAAGTLPNFSVVTPTQTNSQHNGDSMTVGDNWIGSVVNSVESSPQWSSTAIFITWDDCGCFYDHVAPPAGLGIRVPMLIVSPYPVSSHRDSTTASFASVLAFTESAFGLPPITGTTWDARAYGYMNSFNFLQAPLSPVKLSMTPITAQMIQAVQASPPDPNDST
jgi:phospholipase C